MWCGQNRGDRVLRVMKRKPYRFQNDRCGVGFALGMRPSATRIGFRRVPVPGARGSDFGPSGRRCGKAASYGDAGNGEDSGPSGEREEKGSPAGDGFVRPAWTPGGGQAVVRMFTRRRRPESPRSGRTFWKGSPHLAQSVRIECFPRFH